MSTKQFLEIVKSRRTLYALTNKTAVPKEDILRVVREALLHTPSAFNSQTTRMAVLFQKDHEKLWDATKSILKAMVSAEQFPATEKRLDGFRSAFGTVLFYEDQRAVTALQEKIPPYKDRVPDWSQHTAGMHQWVVWTGLEELGLGCSLQHYNPLIDTKIQTEWSIPDSWTLIAQMPFGHPVAPPMEKTFTPLEDRLRVFGMEESK